jgi:hypothetical protein
LAAGIVHIVNNALVVSVSLFLLIR